MSSLTSTTTLAQSGFLAFIRRHNLITFFILAFAFSWIAAAPAIFLGVPFKPFQTLGAYGPLLAAFIISVVSGGRAGGTALLRRMTTWRFKPAFYLLAIFGLVVLYILAVVLAGVLPVQSLAGKWSLLITFYLPALFTTYLINPIGEETGWTGFALPHLQKRFSPWLSACILGVVWAIWHLPAYMIPSELGTFNPVGFVIFIIIAMLTRLIWTWVTNNAKGSGIAAILLHASSNAVSVGLLPLLLPPPPVNQGDDFSGPILLGLLLLSAALPLIFTRGRLSYDKNTTRAE